MKQSGFTPTPILALLRGVYQNFFGQISFFDDSKIFTSKLKCSKTRCQYGRRGFTLIELLVVIAIIGILATIVLASLNGARVKANDVAIKSNLDNARAAASLYYDNNNQVYTGVCTSPTGIAPLISGAISSGSPSTPVCNESTNAWALEAQLKANPTTYWCVDWTGTSTTTTVAPLAGTNCV